MNNYGSDVSEVERTVRIRARQKFMLEFVLKFYAAMGVVLAVGALGYFIFTTMDIVVTRSQQIALIAAGSGAALSVMSSLLLMLRRQRDSYETQRLMEFAAAAELIECWSKFEEVSRKVLELEGDKINRYSLRSIIANLRREEKITDTDLRVLHEALDMRNIVVHGGGRFPSQFIGRVTVELAGVIAKLSREGMKQREH